MKDILGREIQVGQVVAHLTRSGAHMGARAGVVSGFVNVTGNYNYLPYREAVAVDWLRTRSPEASKPILPKNLLILDRGGLDV